jgi:hypothetical protein
MLQAVRVRPVLRPGLAWLYEQKNSGAAAALRKYRGCNVGHSCTPEPAYLMVTAVGVPAAVTIPSVAKAADSRRLAAASLILNAASPALNAATPILGNTENSPARSVSSSRATAPHGPASWALSRAFTSKKKQKVKPPNKQKSRLRPR